MVTMADLQGFTGTEGYTRHTCVGFGAILTTDGVQYLAKEGKCYWLLDLIGYAQTLPVVKEQPFQVWEVKRPLGSSGVKVTMKPDADMPDIVGRVIPWSDFPLPECKLYFIDGVLLLPSEY
jgi:hypothetical protein